MAAHQYLDLSTRHLPHSEREGLDEGDAPGVIRPFTYGWWVHVHELADSYDNADQEDEEYEDFPALLAAIRRARELGCTWILLDSDGELDDELPTHDD